MTIRAALATLALTTSTLACGGSDLATTAGATEGEEQASDALTAGPAQVCQNVFDAVGPQGATFPHLTLTWLRDTGVAVIDDGVGIDPSGRVLAQGSLAFDGVSSDASTSYTLIFRKRTQLLPSGVRIPMSSLLEFEIVGRTATVTRFSVVPTECVNLGTTAIITATGPDGSRLTATIARLGIGG